MCHALVEDPEYLQAERARSRNRREPFDVIGLCLLAVTMVCWEVMLSKGQEWDWLGDPFYRVQTLLILFLLGLGGLIYRELHLRNPLVALRTLADRNFGICCVIIFCAYGVLYANTHLASRFAAVPLWLRRNHFRFGAFAIRNLRHHHAGCRRRTCCRAVSMPAI